MKAARALLFCFALCSLVTTGLGALDFDLGGTIDDFTSLPVIVTSTNAIFAPDQRNKVGVWADLHLGSTMAFTAEGSYNFTLQVPYLFNIDTLRVDWRILPWLGVTMGRFPFSDFTGHVLDHTLDGALLALDLPGASVSAGVGYSGLQLKPVSQILMSRSDAADQTNSAVFFAAPRLIGNIEFLFPNLYSGVDMNLAAVLQQDLRPASQLIQSGEPDQTVAGLSGGSLTTVYLGIGLSGTIAPSLYGSIFGYINKGGTLSYVADSASVTGYSYQNEPILAFLAGFGLKYYREEFFASRLELQAVYSSGDADNTTFVEGNTSGDSTLFVPISQEVLGLAFTPQLGNLVLLNLSYSFKPFARSTSVAKDLQIIAKSLWFFRPTTGAISQPGLSSPSTDLYLGTEEDLVANFRPLSDLGLVFSTGVYLPYGGALGGTSIGPTIVGRIELSMSF